MSRLRPFALVCVVAMVFAACATKKEAPPTKKESAANQESSKALKVRSKEMERTQSQKEFLVSHFMKAGDEARQRGDWEEARKNYARVIQVAPENVKAHDRLAEVEGYLGMRGGSVKSALNQAKDLKAVRRQQAQAEITDLVQQGEKLEKEDSYEESLKKYQRALLIEGLYPYYGAFSPTSEQLKDMIARATARKVKAEQAQHQEELQQAQKMKEAAERRAQASHAARVEALMQNAGRAMEQNDFGLAEQYAQQIVALDPTNEHAAQLVQLARRAKLAMDRDATRRNIREQWKTAMEEIQKAAIPQTKTVVWPKSWLTKQALRKPYQFSHSLGSAESQQDQEVENKIANTKVASINFDNTSWGDAIIYLRRIAGVNIVTMPAVHEQKSDADLALTLQVSAITIKSALDIITYQKGLSYRVQDGLVEITTQAQALGASVLDLYDVKDLTVPVQSFPGKDINLASSGAGGGLGGFFNSEQPEPRKLFEGDQLAQLIRDTIDPDFWNSGNGSVEFREGGILVVKAPKSIHSQIRHLLDSLRATGGLTVSIETRFITVEDNFLQEIGVDVRGLGDQSRGLGIPGKGTAVQFDDVLNGNPNSPAGIGTSNAAGVYYNINHNGDLRGRVQNLLDTALGRPGVITDSGGLAFQATYLDDTQAEVILKAVQKSNRSTVVVAPKITVYNHERANVSVLNQVSYVGDFNVQIAQAAQIGDPVVETLQDGVILDVTPIVSADRKYITLELRPTVAILQRPIATFSTTLANGPPVIIQLPEIHIQRVRTTVTIPDGGILLLGGLKFFQEEREDSSVPWLGNIPIISFFLSRKGTFTDKKALLILLKAKIISLEDQEPKAIQAQK